MRKQETGKKWKRRQLLASLSSTQIRPYEKHANRKGKREEKRRKGTLKEEN